jgi:hypothetical protein
MHKAPPCRGDTEKVHTPRHEVGGHQHPGVARAEAVHLALPLRVRHPRVYQPYVQPVARQLLRLGPGLGLRI